jgi:phytanoyl-CoA hydroxylase
MIVELGSSSVSAEKMRQIREKFETAGYVILRKALSPQIIEGVRQEVKKLVDERLARFKSEGKITDLFENEPFETRLIKAAAQHKDASPACFREDLHRPGLFPFLMNPTLLDVAEEFLGPEIRLYPNYMCRPKLPDDVRTLITWHQDAAYTADFKAKGNVEELRTVNLWSSIVPARVENGCMQFIPGTHKLGLVPFHQVQEIHLEIDDSELKPRLKDAVNIEMDPGDVVLFHNMLFHQGLPNRSNTIRWSCDWRYQDLTQPTMRPFNGQVARSRSNPEKAVQSAEQWAQLRFQ